MNRLQEIFFKKKGPVYYRALCIMEVKQYDF